MALYKVKNPVEYSFTIWMNNHPDSTHSKDKDRFYSFVKTVLSCNARRWKDKNFLKDKILELKPKFNAKYLKHLLDLYIDLLDFHGAEPIRKGFSPILDKNIKVKDGYYLEKEAKNGKIHLREVPLKEF